ncbi:Retrovirus-related Pol polyprotein [Thelohanellus kitauei]|uniref:Retrovirus-related Pol polyprotein n=1 Tax=Thelohanellus kitauei TaxID=669202 RepID=A0A0C2M6P7_THEKT|nr:Retrovirus-related Pol polyprotein [Thelohanellus kitauei]
MYSGFYDVKNTNQLSDPAINKIRNWFENNSCPASRPCSESKVVQEFWMMRNELCLVDGILYRKYRNDESFQLRVVVPASLVPSVLRELHDSDVQGCHLGSDKVLSKIRIRFYWKNMKQDVENWCQSCVECSQRSKYGKTRRAPLSSSTSGFPFQRLAIDCVGPLNSTERGHKYIIVVGDYFTKWMEAFPTQNIEAKTIAKVIVDEIVCRYGTPESLHSDQGTNFESNLVKEICQLLRITKTRTTPYRPQSDGMVERFNRTFIDMLSKTLKGDSEWDTYLPKIMFAYRSSCHKVSGCSPYYALFGREAKLPLDLLLPSNQEKSENLSSHCLKLKHNLQRAHNLMVKNLQVHMKSCKALYDKKMYGKPFDIGEYVMIYKPCGNNKLRKYWDGPYIVKEKLSDVTYFVESGNRRISCHYERMKPYIQRRSNLQKADDPCLLEGRSVGCTLSGLTRDNG